MRLAVASGNGFSRGCKAFPHTPVGRDDAPCHPSGLLHTGAEQEVDAIPRASLYSISLNNKQAPPNAVPLSSNHRWTLVLSALLLSLVVITIGCSDDPILGPEGPSDGGGGSYGVINELAPSDSTDEPTSNPEAF